MANMITYNDKSFSVGDTVSISYKIKEGAKDRLQVFKGILLKVKGVDDANRMITVRKVAKDGTGVERIIPLSSPFIADITLDKKSGYQKSKLYFVRDLSDSQIRRKLYSTQLTRRANAKKKSVEEEPAAEQDNG